MRKETEVESKKTKGNKRNESKKQNSEGMSNRNGNEQERKENIMFLLQREKH